MSVPSISDICPARSLLSKRALHTVFCPRRTRTVLAILVRCMLSRCSIESNISRCPRSLLLCPFIIEQLFPFSVCLPPRSVGSTTRATTTNDTHQRSNGSAACVRVPDTGQRCLYKLPLSKHNRGDDHGQLSFCHWLCLCSFLDRTIRQLITGTVIHLLRTNSLIIVGQVSSPVACSTMLSVPLQRGRPSSGFNHGLIGFAK